MEQSVITVIMNGKTFRLSKDRPEAMRHIPKNDRDHLIALLEVVKLQDEGSGVPVQRVEARPATTSPAAIATNNIANTQPIKPERLGAGDADDLMARLIMEERLTKKPGISTLTIYKWAAGIIAVIFVLVVIS